MYFAQRICRKDMKILVLHIYKWIPKVIWWRFAFICESYEFILESFAYIMRKIFFPYENEPNGLSHYIAYPRSNAETFFFLRLPYVKKTIMSVAFQQNSEYPLYFQTMKQNYFLNAAILSILYQISYCLQVNFRPHLIFAHSCQCANF